MKTFFVGIVEPSGSGKTTLCKKLKLSNKNHEHIRLDNYFKHPRTFLLKYDFRNWGKSSNLKFDVLLEHLKELQDGKEVHTKSFPKKAGAKPESITLKPKPVVLIEGFMLFKDRKVRDILDVKVYLEINPEIMLNRRALRFGAVHITDYDTKVAIPEFLKHGTIQKKYADYVIDATRPQTQVVKEVQKIVNQKLVNS